MSINPELVHQIKVHSVDRYAAQKGFRRNRKYWVVGVAYDVSPDKTRGPLYHAVNRRGRVEGFYRDQFRDVIKAAIIPLDAMTPGLRRAWRDCP